MKYKYMTEVYRTHFKTTHNVRKYGQKNWTNTTINMDLWPLDLCMLASHCMPFKHPQDVKKVEKQTNIKNNPDVTSGDAPVSNSTHINLQVAVVSQQPLLHLDQINRMVIQSQQTHTALEHLVGVPTLQTGPLNRTTCGGKDMAWNNFEAASWLFSWLHI